MSPSFAACGGSWANQESGACRGGKKLSPFSDLSPMKRLIHRVAAAGATLLFAASSAMLLTSCASTDSNGAVVTRTPGGPAADTPATTSPTGASNAFGTGVGSSMGGNGLGGSRGSF